MINSITITNHLDESVTIELGFPERSGFLIYGIDGLGPPKADINKTEVAVLDGSFFNSSRATSRNLVFSIIFKDSPDIEGARLKSYKYFPIKNRIKVEVETANRHAFVYGYVESNEPAIFSKQEGTLISVICPEAFFYELNDSVTDFGSLEPVFKFPFSNESTTVKLINFGDLVIETTKNIYYAGDASVGLVFQIHATGPVNDVEITKVETSQTISIDSAVLIAITGSDIVAGDDIILSTVVGDKYAKLIRSGIEYNIINAIGKYPDWFKLEKGDNLFQYSADTGVDKLQFIVLNKIVYEGV